MSFSRRSFLASAGAAGLGAVMPRPVWAGATNFAANYESLSVHRVPQWYSDAKFGIFIHFGVYSVPAFATPGGPAEWYWFHLTHPDNDDGATLRYHRATWGERFEYDKFIPMFRAEQFDPVSWVRLFEDAGAKYFVITSKHHEGFANFHTRLSNRNAVAMGPKRDIVGSLFAAARTHTGLKCGAYYSVGEFFNPSIPRPPFNAYTYAHVPYTGYLQTADYVNFMHAQMRELIDGYDPDVLWGDGAFLAPDNVVPYWHDAAIIAYYYNHARNRAHPKDVVVNNRFMVFSPDGKWWGDFGTPEQYTLKTLEASKWETCQTFAGSWGFNAQEPVSSYKTTADIIRLLVDAVSKNGNLLFNIGPRHDGTISEPMQERLRGVGAWLRINGEAIYGSHYWKQPEDGKVRFTTKPGKFYMTALEWPGQALRIGAPIPVHGDTKIRLLGSDGPPIAWTREGAGIVLEMPQAGPRATQSKDAYTFTFEYPSA
jgi:alpha-L-fucosidase